MCVCLSLLLLFSYILNHENDSTNDLISVSTMQKEISKIPTSISDIFLSVEEVVLISFNYEEEIELYIDHPFHHSIVKVDQTQECGNRRIITLFSGVIVKPEI